MAARPTIYEALGGESAMLALARAWHERCLADPVASHPFTHGRIHPRHAERLAAYWGEMLGGPPTYTDELGTTADVVRTHSGNGPHPDLDDAVSRCFVQALDDAAIRPDPALRDSLTQWFGWSNRLVNHGWPDPEGVPDDLRLPGWDWDGPIA